MTYPRMNKAEYPPLPTMINNEEEYNLVLEYIVMAGTKLDELRHKASNPILTEEARQRLLDTFALADNKYNQLCLMIDNYKQRNPLFNLNEAVKHLQRASN